jgi:hypothetical protein
MDRIRKHAETEPAGKGRGFAQWQFGYDGSADNFKDCWKKAYRHVSSPLSQAELS